MVAEFKILGPVKLRVQGREIDLGRAKIRGLLGILLLSPDTPMSADLIIDRLWDQPGDPGTTGPRVKGREAPPGVAKTLQSYVSMLRKILKRTGAAQLITEHGHYRLEVDRTTVDYHRFRALAESGTRAARQGDHIRAVTELDAAIELWQARLLADLTTSWAFRYAEAMAAQERLPAYQRLLESHLELGNYEQVLSSLRSPVGMAYETDENLAGLRMRALARLEGPAAARASFTTFSRRLREVTGIEPSEWLEQLCRQLQNQAAAGRHEPRPAVLEQAPPQLLPRDIANFVGRSDILAMLDSHLIPDADQPAVVSLYGTPGVGKTALAVRWAHARRDRFPDGVLYADLNGYGRGPRIEPNSVVATFLQAIGIHGPTPEDPQESSQILSRELSGRRMLVVLDNARSSEHIQPLLAATSPCPLLITSRQKLTVASHIGAHTITVPTLMIDEATALLERRIGADRARDDLSATHGLAGLCDGLPLALQLAGEHVAARPDTPLRDLVEYLRDQRRMLDAGSHGDGDTVRALFDLSADSLPADADRMYQLLGIHPSNIISTPAAAAMAGLSCRRTELVLDTLLGAHLVSQPLIDSYQTHDLLHMHADDRARARLSDAELRVAERRMADWYLLTSINAVARLAPLRKQVPQLPQVTDVQPLVFHDKDEAIRWCVRERVQVMAVARYAAQIGLHHHVWRQIGTFGEVFNRYDDPRPVIDMHRIALDSARAVGARDGEIGLLNNIGGVEFRVGRFDAASQHFHQALAAFRELGDSLGESVALFNIANTLLEQGLWRRAIELHQQSLAIAIRIGDKHQQAKVYQRLGDAQHRLEHPDLAVEHFNQSMSLLIEIGEERGVAAVLVNLAELRLEARDVDRAVDYCDRALEIDRRVVDDRQTAAALRVLARARYLQGLHDDAITCAQESVTLCQRLHDPRGESRSLDALAMAYNAVGKHEIAQGMWRNALALCRTTGDSYAATIMASLDGPTAATW